MENFNVLHSVVIYSSCLGVWEVDKVRRLGSFAGKCLLNFGINEHFFYLLRKMVSKQHGQVVLSDEVGEHHFSSGDSFWH